MTHSLQMLFGIVALGLLVGFYLFPSLLLLTHGLKQRLTQAQAPISNNH